MPLLTSYIRNFKNLRILVIGDIMLDRFVYGKVERISPEAPVPVFNFKKSSDMLGGAGNVVANLAALGVKTSFIGVVGQDDRAREISSLLEKLGAYHHLIRLKDYPTIVKTRLIAGNTHLLRVDCEEKWFTPDAVLPTIRSIIEKAVKNADLVLLSDYAKGVLSKSTTQAIIAECRKAGKKVLIDPKGSDWSKYENATLVKPNLKEFKEACGLSVNPSDSDFTKHLSDGAKLIFKRYKIESLLITLSEHGMAYIHSSDPDEVYQIPTLAKEVFDVSGAGDTSLATLGASFAAGASPKEAMKLANTASGIVVGKLGTACVCANELENALSERNPAAAPKSKIVSLAQAAEIAAESKKSGKKTGFTNGCFDLLHLGHLRSFENAKKECDVLFVGVNSDASVKRHKGDLRPIQDEKTRALLVASLETVDYVIVFDDDTALPLVEKIRPDVIAKEGYLLQNWPEAQFVVSYGGRAVTLKRVDGYSTTQTVERIKH